MVIQRTNKPKPKPGPENPLTFGTVTTDHMFMANWKLGEGWKHPRIVPYEYLQLDPTAKVFHYATEIFEGMKAYLGDDQRIRMFRPMKNMDRFHRSATRTSLPLFDRTELKDCLKVNIILIYIVVPGIFLYSVSTVQSNLLFYR